MKLDIEDFVGATVTVSMPGDSEQTGIVKAVSKMSSLGKNSLVERLSESKFLVVLQRDDSAIEVTGDRFVQYHIVKEVG
jgi:hypothetical protein